MNPWASVTPLPPPIALTTQWLQPPGKRRYANEMGDPFVLITNNDLDGLRAELAARCGGGFDLGLTPARDNNRLCALGRHPPSNRTADPVARTRDDDTLTSHPAVIHRRPTVAVCPSPRTRVCNASTQYPTATPRLRPTV